MRPDFLQAVNLGHKVSTVRAGRKRIERGLLVLESTHESILVRVSEVKYKRFSSLTDEDANKDGYANAEQLKKELCSIYPTLRPNSFVTLITFEKIGRSDVIR